MKAAIIGSSNLHLNGIAERNVVQVADALGKQGNIKTDSIQESLKKIYMNRYLKAYMNYENIITVSNRVKSGILETFNVDGNRIAVIPPHVPEYFYHLDNKVKLREKLGLPLDKILILSVSSAQPRKNLGMVKKVVEGLGNGYALVRIGPAVGNSITYNNVDQATINEIYNACDLLYFPTLMEGFGYPVVEAFKTGLPVVSSDIDIIREVSSGAAMLVDPENLQENIRTIKRIMEDKDSLIEKGYNVSRKYSARNIREYNRQIISRVATVIAHTMFPFTARVKDPLSGYFLCRREMLANLKPYKSMYKPLLYMLVFNNKIRSIREIPIEMKSRPTGESKIINNYPKTVMMYSREILTYYREYNRAKWKI